MEDICIILTTTVIIHNNVDFVHEKLFEDRKQTYLRSILQWINKTNFNVFVVDNNGYDFPELNAEKELHKERFRVYSYKECDVHDGHFYLHDTSKGRHEMFSIFNVCKKFDLTNQFKFIIKVSGRYFSPDFEKVFEGKNMSEYKALRQNKSDRCEVAGARSDFADTLFDCCYCIHHIESTYKQRIEAVDEKEVFVLPVLPIEPTQMGGWNALYDNL